MDRSRKILTLVAVLAILCAGVGVAVLMVVTGPEAEKKQAVEPATGVEVHVVTMSEVPLLLGTQGVVEADRVTVLASEVGGRVIEVSPKFKAGGAFEEGGLMLKIDPADYRAAVAVAETSLAGAAEQLAVEQARAVQGLRDWERLGRGGEPDELVLRVPQLERARATVASAEASLERARRDLERTELRAPYDCRVRSTRSELGSVVAPGSVLGEVTSSEDLEVRLPLALKDYGFLDVDEDGRPSGGVKLRAEIGGRQVEWSGRIVRSENEVDRKTLSIYVVAEIESNEQAPPGFKLPPVGLFVDAELTGNPLRGVVALPRLAIRENDRDRGQVYVVEEGDVLGFREIGIRHSDRENAYIDKGLEEGDRVIMTKIDAPVAGKKLKVIDAEAGAPDAASPAESESTEN